MLFFDHGEDDLEGAGVLGLLGGKFTAVELQRGRLSSSADGLADTRSCPAGQAFDTIDNVCRAAEPVFVPSFVKFTKPVPTRTVAPSVVAPSAPAPLVLVAPIPPARDLAPTPVFVPIPPIEEPGFLDKKLVGPVKVKHALLGGALSLLGVAGILLVRRRD